MTTVPVNVSSGAALVASANPAVREQLVERLSGRCGGVQQALGGADALAKLEQGTWQLLFLDRCLPDLDAEEVTAIIRRRFPAIRVVMIDAAEQAVEDAGAAQPENSPSSSQLPACQTWSMSAAPATVIPHRRLAPPASSEPLPGMIGQSTAMQRVYRMVRLVAPRSTSVLIAGATGTGKELVARALHSLSPRASKRLVAVNCAAIPEALLESELFGYTRGAFTGAVQAQQGRVAAAHLGTLFLDEVSELPLALQAKLLRFLEQKEVQRLGTSEVARVDVRVLAASNVDLAGRAASGEFRQDLFYRLSAFPVELPTLAERRSDIAPLAEHFLACMATAMGMPVPRLHPEALRMLEAHPWRGNVRELQHVMERASILVEDGDTVETGHLYFSYPRNLVQMAPARES